MKKTRATLDLDKAIEAFREAVQAALDIGEVKEWDGRMFLKREIQILNAALVLAGQCIGILLYLLVSMNSTQQEAKERTFHLRQSGSQGHGKRTIKILTIGMVEVPLRIQYVVKRLSSEKRQIGQRGKSEGQGFYPLLKWLGIEEQVTPLLWDITAHQSILNTSFEVAQRTLRLMGVHLSTKRVKRLTYCFGKMGLNIRQTYLDQLARGDLSEGQVLTGQRVVISVDGGRTRIRRAKKGHSIATRYHAEWKEPKLFTIYAVDKQGQKISCPMIPITNDGTFGTVEAFMPILEMYFIRLGIREAEQVLLLADGASWIWERIPRLLQRLGVKGAIIGLLDFYHACGHLHEFASAAFLEPQQVFIWFKESRAMLKNGKSEELLEKMKNLSAAATGKQKEHLIAALEYFIKRQNELDYENVAALNLPIGSGSIESLIRQVLNLRLKSTGKSWLNQNAEIVLHARCQWAAGTWSLFRDSVLTAYLTPT